MLFGKFIEEYDKPNFVILLFGKREVLQADKILLTRLTEKVASRRKKMVVNENIG